MFIYLVYFSLWLLLLYSIHRLAHLFFKINTPHKDHHFYADDYTGNNWNWSNLFLYNDTFLSTIDLWITEVIPTVVFSYITGQWWVLGFYYLWAAFLQEIIEHNSKVDLYPFLTSGKWHLVHHRDYRYNYGLFTPLFDILFGTNKKP